MAERAKNKHDNAVTVKLARQLKRVYKELRENQARIEEVRCLFVSSSFRH